MRFLGIDSHKHYLVVAVLERSKVVERFRVELPHELDSFRLRLQPGDQLVVEATSNCFRLHDELAPHVDRFVVANPAQTRGAAAHAAKTDNRCAETLARLLAAGFTREVWLASQKPFKGHLSSSTIESDLFDWLRAKFLLETPPPPADKLLATAHGCVVERTYWIPIYGLYIQDDFQIGPVTFVTLSPDYWKQVLETLPQDKIEEFQEHFVKRKKLRNLAAGRVTYTSDITLGKRTSMDLVSNACAIIRLYHFCALTYHRSNCIPLGQQYDPSLTMLSSSGEGHWNVDMARIPDSEPIWEISRTKIHEMMTMGAFRLGDLLAKETPTEFESKVLQALLLFSRGSLARDTEERLLYVLAALESLLLANSSEPIQAKIGERLALCLGVGDYEKCQQIEARLREVYTIRSQFFHHGGRVVINETLELFLRDVWAFLISTIGELNKWTTKAEFLEAINRRKYSGHTEGARKD